MNKAELLQAYSELAYVCGIVDAMASDTKDGDSKTLAMWRNCDKRLTHAGNVLHNLMLTYDEPEPDELDRLKDENKKLRELLNDFLSCPASCMDPRICEYCEHCDIDYTDDSKESIQAMSCTLVDDAEDLVVGI